MLHVCEGSFIRHQTIGFRVSLKKKPLQEHSILKILIQFNLYEDYKTHLNLLDLTIFPPLKAKRQTSSGVMAAHRSD